MDTYELQVHVERVSGAFELISPFSLPQIRDAVDFSRVLGQQRGGPILQLANKPKH